jgi:hypothetical protein
VIELGDRLGARTLELIDSPSESRDEARLAAHIGAMAGAADLGTFHERALVGVQSQAGFHEGRPLPTGW